MERKFTLMNNDIILLSGVITSNINYFSFQVRNNSNMATFKF